MSTAPAILARLTAMGARIDCRGDRLVVRAGRRPLPVGLIEEARAAKAELSKALSAIEDAQTRNDEHLRETVVDKPRISAAPAEDAQMSTFDEHLRDQERAHGAEDAHLVEPMSIFDESLDFRGFPSRPPSKMLIPPSLSTLDDDEHLQAPTSPAAVSDETGESRAVSVRRGRVPRAWLEGLARLDPVRPPGDVPVKRWQTFIVDIGRFFDGGWGEKAAALGWEALDLFGCDRDRPFARIDHAGLLWVLNGDRLVALSENTATMETGTGTRQTWRRNPSEPGRVLAWELGP